MTRKATLNILGNIMLLVLLAPAFASCGQRQRQHSAGIETYPAYTPRHASHFSIDSIEGMQSLVITVSNPWQGADGVVSRLFVCRGGESAPDGWEGEVLQASPRRVVAMSSSHIAMLDAIGADSVIAGVSGLGFISNRNIRSRLDSLADVGYEGNINYERLAGTRPDLVLLYSVSGASSLEPRLRQLGVPFLYVADYLEESPLGKAEWMVPLAETLGLRHRADSVFGPMPARYDALRRLAASAPTRPRVMLNAPYADSWMMPPTDSYAVKLIQDAGGEYAGPDNNTTSATPLGMEQAFILMSGADFWLNPGQASSVAGLKRAWPRLAGTPPVAGGRVYNNNLRSTPGGGNDYFESGVVRPDLVLRDMVKILHPELVSEPFVYYRRL